MVSAKQDSIGKVGAAVVSGPEHDVVAFAPGWWSVAAGEHASAVSDGQCSALLFCIEALFAADV
ncbi:hypothetical protein [Frigoribacterium sp. CG_9.8]|uniref:hypothetical protein n=1 Tax=Frigoribacterium sp. CG_9.8 TaxID=2787733 RepID=UPI0018CA49A1|nr:hypothetical protein [Frigoribacterium sp. CG_9.8]MBG6107738.1 hypothetical protein [Frigoribacterium sp. CG_9.8]